MVALLVFSGCSTVTTTQPLSSDPKPIDKEQFEGVWLSNDQLLHVMFADNGVGKIAGLEWKDDQFNIARGEMIVADADGKNLLSVRFEEDGKWPDEYFFVEYKFSEQGDLILWAPDPEAFKTLVEEKKLKGTVKQDKNSTNVTITNMPEVFLKVVNSQESMKLFEYKEPVILKKINAKN